MIDISVASRKKRRTSHNTYNEKAKDQITYTQFYQDKYTNIQRKITPTLCLVFHSFVLGSCKIRLVIIKIYIYRIYLCNKVNTLQMILIQMTTECSCIFDKLKTMFSNSCSEIRISGFVRHHTLLGENKNCMYANNSISCMVCNGLWVK